MPAPNPIPDQNAKDTQPAAVAVDIYDQLYHLRGSDRAYLEHLAGLVDAKMRAVAASGTTVDSLRVAVLAALNLADELTSLRARYDTATQSLRQAQREVRHRTGSLAGMLDEVLDEAGDVRRAG